MKLNGYIFFSFVKTVIVIPREKSLKEISKILGEFSYHVKALNSLSFTDINHIAEDIFCPAFALLLNSPSLRNLNTEQRNYPAVDLGDRNTRICIQITSTSDSEKIVSTLTGFQDHQLFKDFDKLYIYIITERQDSYKSQKIQNLINDLGPSVFQNNQIWDYRDFLKESENRLESQLLSEIEHHLVKQITDRKNVNYGIGYYSYESAFPEYENSGTVESNLIQLITPRTVNVAPIIDFDRDEIIQWARSEKWNIPYRSGQKKIVQALLSRTGKPYRSDFTIYQNKIISFHDLESPEFAFNEIIDTPQESLELDYFEETLDRQNLLSYLLKTVIEKRLRREKVRYDPEAKIYFFEKSEGNERKYHWKNSKSASRSVYKFHVKKGKHKDYKWGQHFGFSMTVRFIGSNWYLLAVPEWYITYDGVKRDLITGPERVKYYKGQEKNKQVRTHFLFIYNFLNDILIELLGEEVIEKAFVGVASPLQFRKAHPYIDDKAWNVNDSTINNGGLFS